MPDLDPLKSVSDKEIISNMIFQPTAYNPRLSKDWKKIDKPIGETKMTSVNEKAISPLIFN